MIDKPFTISDHLHLKVCYTLDTPYKNEARRQLAEYILNLVYQDRDCPEEPTTTDEWKALIDPIIASRLTVGEWLEARDQKRKGAA